MTLIRPNGLVEHLWFGARQQVEFDGYGRAQLGPATAELAPSRRPAGSAPEAPAPARSLPWPRGRPDRLNATCCAAHS